MSDKPIFLRRSFLNKEGHHELAGLLCQVDDYREEKHGNCFYGTYKISNCDRAIELAFDFNNEDELENNIFKLDTIVKDTTDMRDFLVSLRGEVEKFNEEKKIEKEKNKAQ